MKVSFWSKHPSHFNVTTDFDMVWLYTNAFVFTLFIHVFAPRLWLIAGLCIRIRNLIVLQELTVHLSNLKFYLSVILCVVCYFVSGVKQWIRSHLCLRNVGQTAFLNVYYLFKPFLSPFKHCHPISNSCKRRSIT